MLEAHILIIDNDPAAAMITQRGLQRLLSAEMTIEIAVSLSEARARCLKGQVDLLIIDPGPDVAGSTALLHELQIERPGIAALVLTAYDTPRLRRQMRALGVEQILAKPIEVHTLGEAVRRHFGCPAV